MAASPRWKVYTPEGEYEASTRHILTAAALMACLGEGATIRDGHALRHTAWTEGVDGHAAESYDDVVILVTARRL